MKIKVVSDLHLEFDKELVYDIGKGDVLVLAGDICTVTDLVEEWICSDCNIKGITPFTDFFNQCVENYNKVFYVIGNHEHYHWDYNITEMWLRKCLPSGITLLHNQSEMYNGYKFCGTTLWSDYNNNEEAINNCVNGMSDYKVIQCGDDVITSETIINENKIAREFLYNEVTNTDDNVIVITHHAPSLLSGTDYHREMGIINGYCNDLESFIKENTNIKYWLHGHIHETNDYMIGDTNIISNPRGYYKHHECEEHNNTLELVV